MAWFQNLADRAENLLNKIDQNAATVLNEQGPKISDKLEGIIIPPESPEKSRSVLTPNLASNNNMKLSSRSSSSSLDSKENVRPVESAKLEEPGADGRISQNSESIHSDRESVNLESGVLDIFEKNQAKCEVLSSKSSSMQNSFIISEEVQALNEKLVKLELENNDLHKQLLNVQHLYSELRNENANLHSQVETANLLVAEAKSEMEQYKARSQRILQEKEELIALKKDSKSTEDDSALFIKYNDELKKELEFQQGKNRELSETIGKLSQEAAMLQQQLVMVQNSFQSSNESLQKELSLEKQMRLGIEEECLVRVQELHLKAQESTQQTQLLQLQNEEVNKLKKLLRNRPNANINEDLDSRIKSLTETLMVKQQTLETVTTEKNALKLQLEKLENEYQNNLAQLQRAQVRVINVNDTDDVKSQVPQFLRLSQLDAGVTRRVKHAYSTVDAISVRTGIFLRRYPLARVLVFSYMVLLHFWVLIILLLYVPSTR